jgi:hypothetical protein
MLKPLYQQIQELEEELINLRSKLDDISKGTEEKDIKPYSAVGSKRDRSQSHPTDVSTGLGQVFTGGVIWNDSDQKIPAYGTKPITPTKGYNRHSHSRYSGGALDINTLEILEYDVNWETDDDISKHSQGLWNYIPRLKTQQNTAKENVDKIGLLDLIFNADTVKWGVSSFEIDIKKCYLVSRDPITGEIEKDENNVEKKALLYNTDTTKTNIVWDKNAKCWRFYAVYAETPVIP